MLTKEELELFNNSLVKGHSTYSGKTFDIEIGEHYADRVHYYDCALCANWAGGSRCTNYNPIRYTLYSLVDNKKVPPVYCTNYKRRNDLGTRQCKDEDNIIKRKLQLLKENH